MDNTLTNLTRRKVLGSLGALGAGAALGGAGTAAFFSDQETFANNELVAGSLDLKVDWEEHYVDWLGAETDVGSARMVDSADDVGDGEVGLPDPENPMIAVAEGDLEAFMNATSLEAYPDSDDDGVQDDLGQYDACTALADTPDDLDPSGDGALRTMNEDTYDPEEGTYYPLVNLADVKPGDFGELTLSFHLCDNPGYIWLTGGLVDESENGVTEPESNDPDEEDGVVELADEIQTMLWYDEDGDNVYEPGGRGESVCVQLVLDASGSMAGERNAQAKSAAKLLAQQVLDADDGNRVGVTYFGEFDTPARVVQSVTDDQTAVDSAIDGLPVEDGTPIGEGILAADDDFANCSPDKRHVQIVITDGQHNLGTDPSAAADDVTGTDAVDYTDEIFAVGTGGATESSLSEFARPSDDDHVAFGDDPSALNEILGQIGLVLTGEQAFFHGSLRELLDELSTTRPDSGAAGIPLDGNRATSFDEIEGNPADAGRECFVASTTNAVGLAWWLPADHGNEVQTDSVSFDLGFYTEQCRHNDGTGLPPAGNQQV